MQKKISPEERLAIARNEMATGILEFILIIVYSIFVEHSFSLVLLLILGGVFLLGLSIYYFVTQKAYAEYYANVKPLATPVSEESLEPTELSSQSKSNKVSEKTSPIFKIYNTIGIIGILAIVLFIYFGQVTSVILPIIFIVLIVITIGVALYHLRMSRIQK